MLSRLLALLLFAACASGLKMMPPTPRSAAMCSRRAVPLVAAGLAFASRAPAFADDKSKSDKKFISCISECVYTEQKIAKGIAEVEYVTQKEALAKWTSTVKAPPSLGLGLGLGLGFGGHRQAQACVDAYVPGPPYCTCGVRAPASCGLYVPEAQGSLPPGALTRHAVPASCHRQVRQHAQSAPLGSAPARPLQQCLLRARRVALGSSALPG